METAVINEPSIRGMLLTLLAAVGLFMMASGCGRMLSSLRREHYNDDERGDASLPGDGVMSFSLVNPVNDTAVGLKPTRTRTSDCVGDRRRPVLAGADVVAYRRLEEGSNPVMGFKHINASYRGYLFFFATLGNQKAFKASPLPVSVQ